MPPFRRLAWASCLALACATTTTESSKPTTDPAAQVDVDAARAFQIEYERDLRADGHSFLTVIESHYIGHDGGFELVVADEHTLQFQPSPGELLVSWTGEKTPFSVSIADRGAVEFDREGRYSLTVSRQESDWRVLVHDRDAPLRETFPGIVWFPIDPSLIVDAQFEVQATREPSVVQTSRGVTKTLYVAGKATFELDGRPLELTAFAYSSEPAPDEPLLIPFRDETTGHESYTAGRYLEPTLPSGATLRLDFNRATNPLCAYSEHYNCPMPPRYNTLPIAIQAGAKSPPPH
jgi:uncharacterized protein (DUF1684 family)